MSVRCVLMTSLCCREGCDHGVLRCHKDSLPSVVAVQPAPMATIEAPPLPPPQSPPPAASSASPATHRASSVPTAPPAPAVPPSSPASPPSSSPVLPSQCCDNTSQACLACNSSCLGGCRGPLNTDCVYCRELKYVRNGTTYCLSSCLSHTYQRGVLCLTCTSNVTDVLCPPDPCWLGFEYNRDTYECQLTK